MNRAVKTNAVSRLKVLAARPTISPEEQAERDLLVRNAIGTLQEILGPYGLRVSVFELKFPKVIFVFTGRGDGKFFYNFATKKIEGGYIDTDEVGESIQFTKLETNIQECAELMGKAKLQLKAAMFERNILCSFTEAFAPHLADKAKAIPNP